MLGYGVWVLVGIVSQSQHRTWMDAYFHSEQSVDGTAYSRFHGVWSDFGSLFTSGQNLYSAVAADPVGIVVQMLLATAVTAAVWAAARWLARTIACRGVRHLDTLLEPTARDLAGPSWAFVAMSPLVGFTAAIAFGIALLTPAQVPGWILSCGGANAEHLGLVIPMAPALVSGGLWMRQAVWSSRRRQAAAHRSGMWCSRCGYDFGNASAKRCPECGAMPPAESVVRSGHGKILAVMTIMLAAAAISGFCRSGKAPELLAVALDPNRFYVDSGYRVMLPQRRPVRVDGEWGRLYLVAVPVDSGETLVRAVWEPTGSEAKQQTVLIGPTSLPAAREQVTILPSTATRAGTLLASAFNFSFSDPLGRVVIVDQFARAPDRVLSLPHDADMPASIRMMARSRVANAAEAAPMLGAD